MLNLCKEFREKLEKAIGESIEENQSRLHFASTPLQKNPFYKNDQVFRSNVYADKKNTAQGIGKAADTLFKHIATQTMPPMDVEKSYQVSFRITDDPNFINQNIISMASREITQNSPVIQPSYLPDFTEDLPRQMVEIDLSNEGCVCEKLRIKRANGDFVQYKLSEDITDRILDFLNKLNEGKQKT